MRFVRSLVALTLASVPAFAQAPAPAPQPAAGDAFEMTVGGSPLGGEEAMRVEGPDGVGLTGTVRLTIPGAGAGTLTQTTKLARDGKPLSYALDIDVPGQQLVIQAMPTEAGFALSVTPRGATVPVKTTAVSGAAPVFLLDNSFGSHLDVLTRALGDLAVGQERSITALVPQALIAIPAKVVRTADGSGTLNGTAVATRTYAVTLANVREELAARASDGALLEVAVPIQQLLIRRKGFEPAAAKPAAAAGPAGDDARETATEVKSPVGSLPATLLVPKGASPVPGVVFLSGSGPNDRDETIGPNKPFRDIARGLGDRGIASLRVDKRTHAIKDRSKLDNVQLKDEYYDDAALALALLRATPGVDPKRIFVLGHSEGAMVAPRVVAADAGVRGMVLMAPGVRPIDEMLVDQMAYGAKLTGLTADDIAEQSKQLKETFAAIRDPKRLNTPPFMGAPAAYWREVIALDVPAMVRDAKVPVLVLQGDKDMQVRKDRDFDVLKAKAGTAGGRITYRNFPDLNHLFIKIEGESTGAEYGIPGVVEPAVVAVIADWVLAR